MDEKLLALDALRTASLWFTLCDMDDSDLEFHNSKHHERLKLIAQAKIDAAIDALTTERFHAT